MTFNTKPVDTQIMTDRRTFYGKYRASILFNKNLIIAGISGFLGSAYVSHVYSQIDKNEIANSLVAVATEYAVYLPLFATLFYYDNRETYIERSTGKKNDRQIRSDIKKLFASFSVSEVMFSLVRFGSQLGLLRLEIEAYEASMLSSITAWVIFFVSINIMARFTRLHNN